MKSIFKNRITQESEKTMRKLRSTYIDMNTDKEQLPDTPNGLFSITIQPNCLIDSVRLENDFKHILCLFYHWMYGSKWTSLKHLQYQFEGLVERQTGGYPHIHFTLNCFNIVDVAIFGGYIKKQFKTIYSKTSIRIKKCYDINKWQNYISVFPTDKDKYVTKKRLEKPILITDYYYK